MIPLSAPDVTEPEIEAVANVLRTPQLSLGARLVEFEDCFTRLTGVAHAVGVSSGTAGLHLAIRVLGIGPGDEVIVPSFTFIAVANAVRYEQATPVFADIDEDSLNLSPAAVERAITPRTRAILAVHTFGRPAEMAALRAIAQRNGLALIEDACEAIGGEIGGQPVGSFGDIGVFAFYPNKQITTGEGGMVVTPDPDLAARMRSLRNQGRAGGAGGLPASGDGHAAAGHTGGWFEHSELGYNYRLSEIACTLGIGQMARLAGILERREQIAGLYQHELATAPALILPPLQVRGARLSWFVYVVRLSATHTADQRDQVLTELRQQQIGCGRYFAPIHLQPAYRGLDQGELLPVTESVASRTIALPFFNRIESRQVTKVCDVLRAAVERIS